MPPVVAAAVHLGFIPHATARYQMHREEELALVLSNLTDGDDVWVGF